MRAVRSASDRAARSLASRRARSFLRFLVGDVPRHRDEFLDGGGRAANLLGIANWRHDHIPPLWCAFDGWPKRVEPSFALGDGVVDGLPREPRVVVPGRRPVVTHQAIRVVNFEERQSRTIHQDDAAVGFEHLFSRQSDRGCSC